MMAFYQSQPGQLFVVIKELQMTTTQERSELKIASVSTALTANDPKVWTDEAFMALPNDGNCYKLVNKA